MASPRELLIAIKTLFSRQGTDDAKRALDETGKAAEAAAQKGSQAGEQVTTSEAKQAAAVKQTTEALAAKAKAAEDAAKASTSKGSDQSSASGSPAAPPPAAVVPPVPTPQAPRDYATALSALKTASDNATASLNAQATQLTEIIRQTTAAGGSTEGLQAQLARVQQAGAAQWLGTYRKGLEQLVLSERAAGRETSGLEAILGGVAASSAEVDKKTADADKRMRQFSAAGSGATQVLTGLQQASQGGAGAVIGLSNAVRGVIQSVTAGIGPWGIAITLIGLLGGAFLALKDKILPAKRGLDEVGGAADDAANALNRGRQAAEEFDRVSLGALQQNLGEADRAASLLERSLLAAFEAQKNLEQARVAADIAVTQNDPGLDEITRARRLADLQLQQRLAGARDPVERAEIGSQIADQRVQNQQRTIDELRARLRDQEETVRQTPIPALDERRAEELEQERTRLGAERNRAIVQSARPDLSTADREAAELRISQINTRLDEIDRALSPEAVEAFTAATQTAAKTRAALEAAERELEQRSLALAEARKRQTDLEANRQQIEPEIRRESEANREGKVRSAEEADRRTARPDVQERARPIAERVVSGARDIQTDSRIQLTPQQQAFAKVLEAAGERAGKSATPENLDDLDKALRDFGRSVTGTSDTLVQRLLQIIGDLDKLRTPDRTPPARRDDTIYRRDPIAERTQRQDAAVPAAPLDRDAGRIQLSRRQRVHADEPSAPIDRDAGRITVGGRDYQPPRLPDTTAPDRPQTPLAPIPAPTPLAPQPPPTPIREPAPPPPVAQQQPQASPPDTRALDSAAQKLDQAASQPAPSLDRIASSVEGAARAMLAKYSAQERALSAAVARIDRVEQQLRYAKDGV